MNKAVNDNKRAIRDIQNSNMPDSKKQELITRGIKKHGRLKEAENLEKIKNIISDHKL